MKNKIITKDREKNLTLIFYWLFAICHKCECIYRIQRFGRGRIKARKSFFIISAKHVEVAEAIEQQLGRDITLLNGKGYYTKEKKEIIYIIINRREVLRVKRIVEMINPNPFMTISYVKEVTGEGFTYLAEEVQAQRITEAQEEWDS